MATPFCPKCGTANPPERTTCQQCFVLLKQPPGPSPIVCPTCRAVSPTGSAHCMGCGARLGAAPAPAAPGPPVQAPVAPRPGVGAAGPPKIAAGPSGAPALAVKEDLALVSRLIMGMGGFWVAVGWFCLLVKLLAPVIIFKFEIHVSAAVFWGIPLVLHLLEQVWVYLDISDRGSSKGWLACTLLVPIGLALYMMLERSDE